MDAYDELRPNHCAGREEALLDTRNSILATIGFKQISSFLSCTEFLFAACTSSLKFLTHLLREHSPADGAILVASPLPLVHFMNIIGMLARLAAPHSP
jgi:hypothetical protein